MDGRIRNKARSVPLTNGGEAVWNRDSAGNKMGVFGPTVPTDATAGYGVGCIFQHNDGTDNTSLYVNEGTATSCDFNPVHIQSAGAALTAALTAVTHTAPGTPDYAVQDLINTNAFGFVTKDEGNTVLSVIVRTALRVSEIEARLQAAGIIA